MKLLRKQVKSCIPNVFISLKYVRLNNVSDQKKKLEKKPNPFWGEMISGR